RMRPPRGRRLLLRRLTVVEVGRERYEAVGREAVAYAADVIVQTPPLLEHDDSRTAARVGHREIAARGRSVRLELNLRHGFSSSRAVAGTRPRGRCACAWAKATARRRRLARPGGSRLPR